MEARLALFLDWFKAMRVVANCIAYVSKLKRHVNKDNSNSTQTIQTVNGLHKAEVVIIRVMQHTAFPEQMKILKQGTDTSASEARRLKRNDLFC